MATPIIRVEDWEEDPPIPTKYIYLDNELDLTDMWTTINSLTNHPGRGCIEIVAALTGPVSKQLHLKQCTEDFLTTFWAAAAKLLDYFADFYPHDTPTNQTLWFHLLDVLKDSASLPHEYRDHRKPACIHAKQFARDYVHTLSLVNQLIAPHGSSRVATRLVNANTKVRGDDEERDLRGWKSGLGPWQQYMFCGAPGLELPAKERIHPHLMITKWEVAGIVPAGGLAIMEAHLRRGRKLVGEVEERESDNVTAGELLAQYDQHSFKLDGKPFTYTSITGEKKSTQMWYTHSFSKRAPVRPPGLGDPSCLIEDAGLNLMDECAGYHKGTLDLDGYNLAPTNLSPNITHKLYALEIYRYTYKQSFSSGGSFGSSTADVGGEECKVEIAKYMNIFEDWIGEEGQD